MSEETEDALERYRTAAYLQFFRVAAILGAFLGTNLVALLGLAVVVLIEPTFTVAPASLFGVEAPLFSVIKAGFVAEIIRNTVQLLYQEDPAFHRIETDE